jgi:hypothetical protein
MIRLRRPCLLDNIECFTLLKYAGRDFPASLTVQFLARLGSGRRLLLSDRLHLFDMFRVYDFRYAMSPSLVLGRARFLLTRRRRALCDVRARCRLDTCTSTMDLGYILRWSPAYDCLPLPIYLQRPRAIGRIG